MAFLNFSKIVLKSRYSYNFKTIFLTVYALKSFLCRCLSLCEIGASFNFGKSWLIGIIWWKLQEIGIAKFLAFSYCDMTGVLNWQSHMTFVWQYVSFSQSTIYFCFSLLTNMMYRKYRLFLLLNNEHVPNTILILDLSIEIEKKVIRKIRHQRFQTEDAL